MRSGRRLARFCRSFIVAVMSAVAVMMANTTWRCMTMTRGRPATVARSTAGTRAANASTGRRCRRSESIIVPWTIAAAVCRRPNPNP